MNTNVKKLAGTALLSALIIVLQTFASGIKIGPFTPTLSLIPIIIGAIMYGPLAGGFLGLVFGVVVIVGVLSGAEAMSTMMLELHPVITILVCLGKGALAGIVPGLLYRLLKDRNETLATAAAAISAPIMNTGIFCICLMLFFRSIAESVGKAIGFSGAVQFIFAGIVGTNFLFELALNAILIPVVARIINAINHK